MNSPSGRCLKRPKTASASLLLGLFLTSGAAMAQDFSIDWHTLDGGGELLSESDNQVWQLSGTIGQPDATELIDLSGNGWTLTGGFWAVNIEQTDLLFRDSFEGEDAPP